MFNSDDRVSRAVLADLSACVGTNRASGGLGRQRNSEIEIMAFTTARDSTTKWTVLVALFLGFAFLGYLFLVPAFTENPAPSAAQAAAGTLEADVAATPMTDTAPESRPSA
jgi:hypothetical protein